MSRARARCNRILTAATDERVTMAISSSDNSPTARSRRTSRSALRSRFIVRMTISSSARRSYESTPVSLACAARMKSSGFNSARRLIALPARRLATEKTNASGDSGGPKRRHLSTRAASASCAMSWPVLRHPVRPVAYATRRGARAATVASRSTDDMYPLST